MRVALCVLFWLGLPVLTWAEEQRQAAPLDGPIASLANLQSVKHIASQAPIAVPKVEELWSKQGVRVLFVAAPELPMLDMQFTFNAGSARDAEGKEGQATLTARMLDQGTPTLTAEQIVNGFEQRGAVFSARAYKDMFAVGLRSLTQADILEANIGLFKQVLHHADFPQAALARIFSNSNIGQQQQNESPATLAQIRFASELYGNHPYAHPAVGTPAGLQALQRQDLLAFKQQYLVARNVTVALVGALSSAEALALVELVLADMPTGETVAPLADPAPQLQARTVHVPYVASQSHVMMGVVGASRRDAQAMYALNVANELLGGGDFNALLMHELREKRGLTYGAFSVVQALQARGAFIITFSTESSNTKLAIEVAEQTLHRFVAEPIAPNRLQEVKQNLLLRFPAEFANNDAKLAYLVFMGFYQLPRDYLETYTRQMAGLDEKIVKSTFAAMLGEQKLLKVVVGVQQD